MCLNLYWRSSSSLPWRFPKSPMYPFTEPYSFATSKIVLAFSTVARIFFSFRTIPGSCVNARMSRSDSRATFSGEKSRNAFRKWGHFFSTICQFKPALKIALDIRSRYPSSSFGGTAFHPGMGTPTLFALFMPTFGAILVSSWVGRRERQFQPSGQNGGAVPFTEKGTGWDLNPESRPCTRTRGRVPKSPQRGGIFRFGISDGGPMQPIPIYIGDSYRILGNNADTDIHRQLAAHHLGACPR